MFNKSRNPFKALNRFPKDELASPRSLALPPSPVIPSITRPERPIEPEIRRERFRRLSGILSGFKKPSI